MLILFKASNFRSIKGEITLSLAASNYDKNLPENMVNPDLARLKKTRVLKGAAIFGPNASGKSNVLAALGFMKRFVVGSATGIGPGDPTGATPFCLDKEYCAGASAFEVVVVIKGVRFLYGFSVDSHRVRREYLTAYPKGLAQKWFVRNYDTQSDEYVWEHSEANFKLDKDLRQRTRPNCLFLSVGAQFNNAQLTEVYNWFRRSLQILELGAERGFPPGFTMDMISDDRGKAEAVLALMKAADMGIVGAEIQRQNLTAEQVRQALPPELRRQVEADDSLKGEARKVLFKHHGTADDGGTVIEFNDESSGTRRFFALAGPWLDIIENGYTVLIDELETSLHPDLVREFLRLLFRNTNNRPAAQVIFTAHSPILLDQELLRRDQIWFTEKGRDGGTRLYPLTDYKPRNNEALSRGYMAGRYGALPFIPKGLRA